jgi:hypothetical protein
MRYEVFAGDELIGWSELEKGDPPMGVAEGRLMTTPAYCPTQHALPHQPQLRIRAVGDTFLEHTGAYIEDQSAALGPDGIEVIILGLPLDSYRRHFSQHLKAYAEQFEK